MSEPFFPAFFHSFFIALGVVLGGTIIGSLSSFITGEPIMTDMAKIAKEIRIWAIIAAIGGTFDTVYSVERGVLQGETRDLLKQVLLILSGMGGAQSAALLITWITQEHVS